MRKLTILLLSALLALSAAAQTSKEKKDDKIYLHGMVADGFTKAAIPDVLVTLMREDSTVVDTVRTYQSYSYASGLGEMPTTTHYYFSVKREPAKYVLKMEHPNYETAYASFEMKQVSRRRTDIEGPKVYLRKTAKASHFLGGDLEGVEIKATKVKMVWRGDTLVFNADAFNVPEGSMLDGLIKQLPGVELKDNGEIYVNGKKIDNLTLNGADFFKGKNKVMLQNLPYFTVKNVEVYKKQTEENKYLGIDDEDKKEYTMDVILKREYSIGGSANVEAGGGPSDGGGWRYKLKGFGLRFSDHTRAVLFGGMNNINESMEFSAENSDYNTRTQQSGDRHFRQVGGQFAYIGPENKVNNSTEVSATWSNEHSITRGQSSSFLSGANSFGKSDDNSRNRIGRFSLGNTLRTTGKYRFYSRTGIEYTRNNMEADGWNVTTADAVMNDSINGSWYRSRNEGGQLRANGYAYLAKRLPTGDSFSFSVQGNYNRGVRPESTSLNHYKYYLLGTQDHRDRCTSSPNHSYDLSATIDYNYQLSEAVRIVPSVGLGTADSRNDRHEYLRDSIDYRFDMQNSYEQRTRTLNRRAGITIDYTKYKNDSTGFYNFMIWGQLSTNFQRQRMSYQSEPMTTSLTRYYVLLSPQIYIYYMSSDSIQRKSFYFNYYLWPSTPSVTDLIDRPITSDPLNIFQGNDKLKISTQHQIMADYDINRDSIDQTISARLVASITHNARTQGYTYDPTTGVRTFRPENIRGGNWSTSLTLTWNRALDKRKFWHIGNELGLGYAKSTALAMAIGAASESGQLSRVGNFSINYKPSVRFQKNNLTFSIKGDLNYHNIHRNITYGEQPTDIWDLGYGINANYKLPWNFTIDTDLMMHSRRGYTEAEMNDNRLYWDAALTKSLHQGRWLLKLRGYDLLGQVSTLRYSINSQGRTETWTNSLRRYALLTVSYQFSHKPKKKN